MNTYETTFILEPGLDEAQVNEQIDLVTGWIKGGDGEVIEVQRWGKKRLAYEINKKRDGIYTMILHKSPGAAVKEMGRRLRLTESLMRLLTVIHVPTPPPVIGETADGEEAGDRVLAAAAVRDDDDDY